MQTPPEAIDHRRFVKRACLLILPTLLISAPVAFAQEAPAAAAAGRAGLTFGTARQVETARGERMTLQQAFAAAIEGSRDLEAARDRVEQAAIEVDRAWATLRPAASVTASITRNDKEVRYPQPDGGERIVQELYSPQVGASIRQVVFQGQAYPTVRALRDLKSATALEGERMRTEVLYAVATTFYSGLALQETLSVTEQQVEGTRRQLEVVTARHELEAANRLDLLRAEIDYRAAVEDQRITAAALTSVKVALSTLVGRPHDEADFSLERPEGQLDSEVLSTLSVEEALENRSDLLALERRISAADHLVTAARLAFLPTLDLTATARYSPVVSFLRDDQFTWLATLNLTVPLYQGGQTSSQLQSARLQARSARRTRDSMADRVRQDVLQARLDLETASAQLERLEGTAELAGETLELTRARYEVGAATSLEVTDATTRSFLAETQVHGGRLDLDMAVLSLARSMGVLESMAESFGRE